MASFTACTEITDACPVSATLYGYVPNFPANTTIDTVFGLALLIHIILMIVPPRTNGKPRRHWGFSIFAFIGITLEFVGYLARIWMDSNVWNKYAIGVQLLCTILGPTFLVAAMYLTLSHLLRVFGAQYSRLPVRYYVWVFVTCDIVSILIQALGGGLAAVQGSLSTVKAGGDLIIAGIVFQVVIMVVVCGLVADYTYQRWMAVRNPPSSDTMVSRKEASGEESINESEQAETTLLTTRFKTLIGLLGTAYVLVLIRSIYRIDEFSQGWGGPAMRQEVPFLILDGAMVALATVFLTITHPALMFLEMC